MIDPLAGISQYSFLMKDSKLKQKPWLDGKTVGSHMLRDLAEASLNIHYLVICIFSFSLYRY